MADLSYVFRELLVGMGYWLLNTLLYMGIIAVIWFLFATPVIKGWKKANDRYANFVKNLLAILMVLVAIASAASFAKIGIIPFPAL